MENLSVLFERVIMSILRKATLAIVLTATASPVIAADMQPIIAPPIIELETTPVEFGSGWYLRGDVGLSINNAMKDGALSEGSSTVVTNYDDVVDFGVGFGQRFNDYFRLEGNFERVLSGSVDTKTNIDPGNCHTLRSVDGVAVINNNWADTPGLTGNDQWAAAGCLDLNSASYDASVLSVDALIDLPSIKIGKTARLTPFVGAGVGIARVNWSEITGARKCTPLLPESGISETCNPGMGDQQVVPGEQLTYGGSVRRGIDYRLAYSLSAGVGVELSDKLTLDLSYRLLNVGGEDVDYTQYGSGHLGDDGFGTHQIKTGLRYEIW